MYDDDDDDDDDDEPLKLIRIHQKKIGGKLISFQQCSRLIKT